MANWAKNDLTDRVLRVLGVVGDGQSPTAGQTDRVGEVIDSVYKRLRPKGLCPFLTSAIPEWAQVPMRDIVAAKVAPEFGYAGARLAERVQLANQGMNDLADAAAGDGEGGPIKIHYF